MSDESSSVNSAIATFVIPFSTGLIEALVIFYTAVAGILPFNPVNAATKKFYAGIAWITATVIGVFVIIYAVPGLTKLQTVIGGLALATQTTFTFIGIHKVIEGTASESIRSDANKILSAELPSGLDDVESQHGNPRSTADSTPVSPTDASTDVPESAGSVGPTPTATLPAKETKT